jgi:hypothetical protein
MSPFRLITRRIAMPPLTDDAVAVACLDAYRAAAPDAWGFGWLAETLAVLVLTELEARPRPVLLVDAALAGALLRAAACLLRDDERRAGARRRLFSPELIDWWARWEALDPALRAMAFAMPVEWLLGLWEAAHRPPDGDDRSPADRRRPPDPITAR